MPSDEPKPVIALGVDGLAVTTHYILIDKSDTSNFKHKGTGALSIQKVWGYLLGLASANVKVEIGVIVAISGTDSTIKWIASEDGIASGDRLLLKDLVPYPITPELDHVSTGGAGSTLYETGVTNYDTATTHKTPFDATGSTVNPAVGDLVMSITVSAGTVDVKAWMEYDN